MTDPHNAFQSVQFVHDPTGLHQQFTAPVSHWTPPTSPSVDPHSAPFVDVTDDVSASKVDGPVAANIEDGGGEFDFDGGTVAPIIGDRADGASAPDAHVADDFEDELAGAWNPNDSAEHPADPHDEPYSSIGDDVEPVDDAPAPDNIIRAADADDDDCDCDDASNIVVRGRISGEALRQAGGIVPGPMSRSRL
jgi:hypothetical protein